jgi:hypothetical protein
MESYPHLFAGFSGLSYLIVTMTASLVTGLAFATLLFLIAEKPYFGSKLAHSTFKIHREMPS